MQIVLAPGASSGRLGRVQRLVVSLLLAWSLAPAARAQEMATPLDVQFALFRKILTFDRKLSAQQGNRKELTIGILYQQGFRASSKTREEAMRLLAEPDFQKLDGVALRGVAIDVGDGKGLAEKVAGHRLDVLYVAPLRAVGIETITEISRGRKLTTLTGVSEYVEEGLAIGIGTRGGKPLIIVNLTAAKAEGCDLDSQLLKLAKVVPGR